MADANEPPIDETDGTGKVLTAEAKEEARDNKGDTKGHVEDQYSQSPPTTTEEMKPENSDKEKRKTEESQPVKLNTVERRYKIHNKSTLPDVLTEYGLEDKTKPKKKEKTRKKKKSGLEFSEYDDEERKRKQKEELFRQKFGDNRSTDKYYSEYFEVLEKKVQQQRLNNQLRKEEEEKKEQEREEEKLKNRHLHKRLQRTELRHDDSFLKKIPKTDLSRHRESYNVGQFYWWWKLEDLEKTTDLRQIVALESKLKREGKLKTQSDMDKFWDEINQPDVFYSQFRTKKQKDSIQQPIGRPGLGQSAITPVLGQDGRSLSHISERQEASRLSQHDSWAITQQFQSQHGTLATEKRRKDSVQLSREAALELEKRFPKLEMPKMSCFAIKLGEKPPDPEEIQRRIALKAREKSRKKYQRKLRKMHQLAMAHAAAANRILAQRGDLDSVLNGTDLRDVLAVFREDYIDVEYEDDEEEEVPPETFMTEPLFDFPTGTTQDFKDIPDGSRRSSYTSVSSAASSRKLAPIESDKSSSKKSSKSRKKKTKEIEAPPVVQVAPLTYSDVLSSGKIVEAKCLSTNWTNYMQAGKSMSTAS